MAVRQTDGWRDDVAEEQAAIAPGALDPEEAVPSRLWPESVIVSTKAALDAFELVLTRLDVTSDAAVLDAVRTLVIALNRVDDAHSDAYATAEREAICGYIDAALEEAGVDLDSLAARKQMARDEITDDWRTW